MPAPTTPISVFDPLVLTYAVGLPVPSARRLVRQAAITFCERTNCWREILTVDVDEANEAIVTPAYATLHRIEEATFDSIKLIPTQYTDLSAADWETEGTPGYITQVNPNTISLIPPATGTLTISAFLKPIEGSSMVTSGSETVDELDVVPTFMFLQYAQQIAWGALARALRIPNQPFTDLAESATYGALFEDACNTHFASNITMQHRATPRSRYHEY